MKVKGLSKGGRLVKLDISERSHLGGRCPWGKKNRGDVSGRLDGPTMGGGKLLPQKERFRVSGGDSGRVVTAHKMVQINYNLRTGMIKSIQGGSGSPSQAAIQNVDYAAIVSNMK